MSLFAKASTRPLLVAAGLDPEVAILRANRFPDEDMAVRRAVDAISKRVRAAHGADVHWGDWPAEPGTIAALQAALPDNAGDRRGHDIAWALIHYGLRDAATFAALHPWDRLMFEWQAKGLDEAGVSAVLQDAGFAPLAPPPAGKGLDPWIRDPVRGMGCGWSLVGSIFEAQLHVAALYSNCEPPRHARLLQDLARHASPPVELEASEHGLEGEHDYHVDYAIDGERHGFDCTGWHEWPDTARVLDEFDAAMARLGRPERVFHFATPREEDAGWGFFVVHDGARFAACNRVLGLPLEPRVAGLAGPR